MSETAKMSTATSDLSRIRLTLNSLAASANILIGIAIVGVANAAGRHEDLSVLGYAVVSVGVCQKLWAFAKWLFLLTPDG
jgi:hypothetical protein